MSDTNNISQYFSTNGNSHSARCEVRSHMLDINWRLTQTEKCVIVGVTYSSIRPFTKVGLRLMGPKLQTAGNNRTETNMWRNSISITTWCVQYVTVYFTTNHSVCAWG